MQGRHALRRSTTGIVQLFVPDNIAAKFCHQKKYGCYENVKAVHRSSLQNLSEAEIVLTFNAEMRGLANYYSLALDMKYKLSKLYFIWQISLFKTLANKRRSSVNKVAKSLRQIMEIWLLPFRPKMDPERLRFSNSNMSIATEQRLSIRNREPHISQPAQQRSCVD